MFRGSIQGCGQTGRYVDDRPKGQDAVALVRSVLDLTGLAGAPVELDLSSIASGAQIKILWRGKPYFVRNRTEAEIKAAVDVDVATLRDPQPDSARVQEGHAKWLVTAANCTHLGCVPLGNQGDYGGWFCPCHGSHFDTSGRIRKGPAPTNLPIPQYTFLSDTRIRITGAAASV